MSKVFLDTNILVYSLDQSDPVKKDKCRELIRGLIAENNAVISTQVMLELAAGRLRCPHSHLPEKLTAPIHIGRPMPFVQPAKIPDGIWTNPFQPLQRQSAELHNLAQRRE